MTAAGKTTLDDEFPVVTFRKRMGIVDTMVIENDSDIKSSDIYWRFSQENGDTLFLTYDSEQYKISRYKMNPRVFTLKMDGKEPQLLIPQFMKEEFLESVIVAKEKAKEQKQQAKDIVKAQLNVFGK